MIRKKHTQIPDAILTADWHLRDTIPTCRTDDFETAQWNKVQFVKDLQKEYQCPVYHAGDLFNHWKPSPYLIAKAIQYLPSQFYTIYGNHDLPQHSLAEQHKCGVYVLEQAGVLEMAYGVHWGQLPSDLSYTMIKDRFVLIWHIMNWQGTRPWPGCTDPRAGALLRKYTDYDLILTGHNHKSFVETHNGKLLVNPGSLTRMDADQIDYRPKVFLYYASTNTTEEVFLPLQEGVVSRAHIERDEERNGRIEAFITQLTGEWKAGLNFETNLEKFFQTNMVRETVKQIIYESLENE